MTDVNGRLPELVRKIAYFHPWYGELLAQRERGSTTGSADTKNLTLERLPLMTAELLERHYYAQPPAAAPSLAQSLSVYRTSGTSSGIRKAIYYSPEDDEHYIASKMQSFADWLGPARGATVRRALADLGTGHAASTALDIFRRLGLEGDAIPFTAPVTEHVRRLRAFRPDLLYTMPSLLEAIADAAPDAARLGLKRIVLVGEIAAPEWQANIARRFGLGPGDILDTYGSIEIGAIAAYSHELGKYVLADGLYGESLRAEELGGHYEPLRPNEGVLALTSFRRLLFPAIRFVTYDVVRDFETVRLGGRSVQTFACIAKRIGPELKHGEKISLYDIEAAVHRHAGDASVRVAASGNRLTVYVKLGRTEASEALTDRIRRDIEHTVDDIGTMIRNGLLGGIAVVAVNDWSRLPSGSVKAKRIYFE